MPKPKVKLTARDYESLRAELIKNIPLYTDKWTDYHSSDVGMTLLEFWAGLQDLLDYNLNVQAGESFLPSTRQRANALRLVKLIGYQPKEAVPAVTNVTFSLSGSTTATDTITIPKFTRVSTVSPTIEFVTVEEVFIPIGSTLVVVEAKQGILQTETFISDGSADQSFTLATSTYGHASAEIEIGGITWTRVETFVDSTSSDRHFRVETNENNSTSIVFGDGVSGTIPADGVTITARYLNTLGEGGNVGANKIVRLIDTIVDNNGDTVSLSINNAEGATGGAPIETILQIKKQAPASFRTLERAVTKEDFIALAEEFPGIKQAKVLDINDYNLFSFEIDYYELRIVVIPDGGNFATQALKDSLLAELEEKKYVTADLSVFDPIYVPIDVDVDVFILDAAGISSATVQASVVSTIRDFFAAADSPLAERRLTGEVNGTVIGEPINASQLIFDLVSIDGVAFVNLNNSDEIENTPITDRKIASLGILNVNIAGSV